MLKALQFTTYVVLYPIILCFVLGFTVFDFTTEYFETLVS